MSVRTWLAALAATLVLASVTGCAYNGASDLPLPGAVGSDGYPVTIVLTDATNLVPKETCRTNDTVVGSVESVKLNDQLQARVVCRIKKDVSVPANVVATLRETSLLGERYVALDVPDGTQATGQLAHGATIPASRTVVHPDTEVVLGALSQVLNGGSLGSIATISREVSQALAAAPATRAPPSPGSTSFSGRSRPTATRWSRPWTRSTTSPAPSPNSGR